jgi:hypothetical protein
MKHPTLTRKIPIATYAATKTFYDEIEPELNGAARGFKILYGPPYVRPPVFFLGLQVGGVAPDEIRNEKETWPEESEYATASWHLAQRLQSIFGVEFLKKSTGTNINFFRAPNDQVWKTDVKPDLRHLCESFSHDHAQRLIEAIQPRKIIVIGFQVIDKIQAYQFKRTEEGVQVGNLWGCPAIAVWHLTGTPMTTAQREGIYRALHEFLKHAK